MYKYTHALTHAMYRIVYISRMLQLDHVLGASRRPGKAYLDKSSARACSRSASMCHGVCVTVGGWRVEGQ